MTDQGPIPSAVERKMQRIYRWNGEPPAPSLSHWTPQGSVIIRAATARKSTSVIWKPKDGEERHLGFDDINPYWPLTNIASGKYDADAGLPISQIVPADWADWNDLA